MPCVSLRAAVSLAALFPFAALAQTVSVNAPVCDGMVVSRVDIEPAPPPFSGSAARWRAAANAVGLHHATTRADVVRAFLSLAPDQPCTEFRRAESERVLRAQPFLSDASVVLVPDGPGRVIVKVATVDEIPVLIGARFRGVRLPVSLNVGNANIGGTGLRLEGRVERARGYRTGFGASLRQEALFGRPYRLLASADRYRVGRELGLEMEHPFFTDLQRVSWHAGVRTRNDYLGIDRPARDPLALRVTDMQWDASSLFRLFGTRTVTLLGGAITGRRFDPAAQGIVVDDTGFAADTGTTLRGRYASFRSGRIGVTAGIRRVSFQTVSGFDALVGSQDVAKGVMLGLHAGRGLSKIGESDTFLSGALYAGAAAPHARLATLAEVEGRRGQGLDEWDSVIGSSRTALYWGSAPGVVLVLANEFSGGLRSRLPLQLTFHERGGGLLGYRNSPLAGARRNVARAELRWSAAALFRRADLGIATFGESGALWAGDAPYGTNVTRSTIGISLLAAYPTRAKRVYRADLGIPLARGGDRGGRIELRFTSEDRTQGFWREPRDVTRARTGTEPNRLFAWPSR